MVGSKSGLEGTRRVQAILYVGSKSDSKGPEESHPFSMRDLRFRLDFTMLVRERGGPSQELFLLSSSIIIQERVQSIDRII